jgi:hypothetical protein
MKSMEDRKKPAFLLPSMRFYPKAPAWKRLLASFFGKLHIGIDQGNGHDRTAKVYAHRLFGKTYITKIEYL